MTQDTTAIVNRLNQITALLTSGGSISNKVPYTGATTSVDLGSQTLTSTGKMSTGTTISANALVQFSSLRGTGRVDIGEYTGGRGAIWLNQATPSISNYALSDSGGTTTFINATAAVDILISGSIYVMFSSTTMTLGAGQTSYDIVCSSTNGTKFGTATSQKIGFYNSTPVVQSLATTDLGTVLSDLGLRATGTAYPLTTSGAINSTGSFSTANFKSGYVAKTTTYLITTSDYLIDCTSGTFTVTLPTAVGNAGRVYIVRNGGAGVITIACNAAETINGVATKVLNTQYTGFIITSDGANNAITGSF